MNLWWHGSLVNSTAGLQQEGPEILVELRVILHGVPQSKNMHVGVNLMPSVWVWLYVYFAVDWWPVQGALEIQQISMTSLSYKAGKMMDGLDLTSDMASWRASTVTSQQQGTVFNPCLAFSWYSGDSFVCL